MSALSTETFLSTKQNPNPWGRWVESSVGAHLINKAMGTDYKIEYWKEGPYEVDFILRLGKKIVAIEVKSGMKKESLPGLAAIRKKHKIHRGIVITNNKHDEHAILLENFFKMELADFFLGNSD